MLVKPDFRGRLPDVVVAALAANNVAGSKVEQRFSADPRAWNTWMCSITAPRYASPAYLDLLNEQYYR